MDENRSGLMGVVAGFLKGNFTVLLVAVTLVGGAIALTVTPREEEPQIVVPLADVLIRYPGGSAEEVERLVSSRLEKMLYQIDGVEYVYSMSRPGMAVVTVRFRVGEDREDSLVKLYSKIQQNMDQVTPGIAGWVIRPIEIDDVPILTATLYSGRYGEPELYRVAEEAAEKLQDIPDSARVTIHGGLRRELHVYLNAERLAAYGVSAPEVMGALKVSNAQAESGQFERGGESVAVRTGPFLQSVEEVGNLVVGLYEARPVYLRDVAAIQDGPAEPTAYARLGIGAAGPQDDPAAGESQPAVTLAVAKKTGSNAVRVAREAERVLEELRRTVIPDDVKVRITRNYGETANEKVNDLVLNLVMAVITVIGLLALTMSWREGLIVAIAVPITYSLTLLVNLLFGYTINRVTLFALILALGLLVDDPIVAVENVDRHLRMKQQPRLAAILAAMQEVLSPIIMSTLAIVAAFLPMFFITGMMGPYMRPMAINVPVTVCMSIVVAITVTPWLANRILRRREDSAEVYDVKGTRVYRVYERIVGPLVDSGRKARLMLGVVGLLFVGSVVLAFTGLVPLKMLPFDNKNEFQIVVDMPETATLEATDGVTRDLEAYLRTVPEVTDFLVTVGAGSPMDFNGMVRHYYLRQGGHVADVRVNLAHRKQRRMDSHAIALRIRRDVAAIGVRHGASLKLVEVPPGPPVLSTVVAEVYGSPHHAYGDLVAAARVVRDRMEQEEGLVDVDDSVEAGQTELFFDVDRDKASLNGVSTEDIVQTLGLALGGAPAGVLHMAGERNELPIVVRLPRSHRSGPAELETMVVKGRGGQMVQVGELGSFRERTVDLSISRKNQNRVVYVTGEMAGRGPAYAVLAMQAYFKGHPLPEGIRVDWRGEGEWKITVDVFRDLGIAFAVALMGIYVLLVVETGSFQVPGIIMLSIPLTMIGIMPGFWLLNVAVNRPVGGYGNPVFFTATAMIGMIALSGIVVRNALVLIDFIRHARARGQDLRSAIVESGAVRLRPIVLTAGTTLLGAWPITFDPIFSGLAWSIIFGLLVSTAFTLVVVPVVYNLIHRGTEA